MEHRGFEGGVLLREERNLRGFHHHAWHDSHDSEHHSRRRDLAMSTANYFAPQCCIQSTRCTSTRRNRGTCRSMPSSNNVSSVMSIIPPTVGQRKRARSRRLYA